MIDWEEIMRTEDPEELRDARTWLFQENIRLERERRRLKEDNLFFDKKMTILQDGFRQLEEDRKSLERERIKLELERERIAAGSVAGLPGTASVAEVLFRSANNPLTLRKRYRDLVKIFHPDNLAGDEELVQLINREFVKRRREE